MGLDQISTKRLIDLETVAYRGVVDIVADYYVDLNINLTANNYLQFLIEETELNGVVLSENDGLKFLLAKQTNKAENGIYQILSLNPTLIYRSFNFRSYSQIQGKTSESVVRIQVLKEGVPNYQGTFYNSSTTEPFVIGTTPIEIIATTPKVTIPFFQEFTGIIEANMEQSFSICDIFPNKGIYEISAKITSSNLTNTATIFYNQNYGEPNGFVSLLTYFIDDSQNKPLLFFPQNCVNLQNKLQIVIKNNTNEIITFQLVTK